MLVALVFLAYVILNGFSEPLEPEFQSLMFVTATSGLNVRSAPSLNSNIRETLQYGEFVRVFSRSDEPTTIDGITSYWYSLDSRLWTRLPQRWVFGGFLSENPPSNPVVGMWDIENRPEIYVLFRQNNGFAGWHYESSGHATYWGTWAIEGNAIVIVLESLAPPGWDREYTTHRLVYRIIDMDNIEISGSLFGSTRFVRNRTGGR